MVCHVQKQSWGILPSVVYYVNFKKMLASNIQTRTVKSSFMESHRKRKRKWWEEIWQSNKPLTANQFIVIPWMPFKLPNSDIYIYILSRESSFFANYGFYFKKMCISFPGNRILWWKSKEICRFSNHRYLTNDGSCWPSTVWSTWQSCYSCSWTQKELL